MMQKSTREFAIAAGTVVLGTLALRYFSRHNQPLDTVASVDLNKYMGKWYEIAAFPQFFEKGCNCTTAEYTLDPAGFVKVVNSCNRNSTKGNVELDKKTNLIHITTENSMRVQHIMDIIMSKMVKQNLDATALDFSAEEYASGPMIKKDVKVRAGVDKETAKKIVKFIKDSKLKVQAAIMDDQIRITGKKIDDLQDVISLMRQSDLGLPLQFVNMKS